MTAQPRDLLADVRAGREPHDLLGQGRLLDAGLRPQLLDAGVQPRHEPGATRLGRRLQTVDEVREGAAPRLEVGQQVSAFAHAHGVQVAQHVLDRGGRGAAQRGPARLVELQLLDDQRPREPQEVARDQAGGDDALGAGLLDGGRQGVDERLVQGDLDLGLPEKPRGHRHLHAAARHPPLHDTAQLDLHRRQQRGQPHLHVEVAVVDGPRRDPEGRRVELPAPGREPRHRLDHRVALVAERVGAAAGAATTAPSSPSCPNTCVA